jgi:hypothetical protein
LTRLPKYGTWVSVGIRLVNIEPPVGRGRSPWRSDWTEFKFTCVQVEPVGIFVDEVFRKITGECGPRDEL